MSKIIIIGSKGQLGNEFQALAPSYSQFEFFYFDRDELDITIAEAVNNKIAEIKPAYLINCAAYTAVDKAETDIEAAFAINSEAVKNLATACTANNVKLVHISTDYVFDGNATEPIDEQYPVNPVSVYGHSKLKGEEEALKYNEDCIIIRTAWVYSIYGNNFVKTMVRLMNSRPEISVVSDQFGTPTYAADLAKAIMDIITSNKWVGGMYHFTNEGEISWYDFANEIKSRINYKGLVIPIPTEGYPTPAKRPKYSVLQKKKIQETFNVEIRDWKESLEECMNKLS